MACNQTIINTAVNVKSPSRVILVVHDDHDASAGWEALKGQTLRPLMTDNKMSKMTGVDLIDKLRHTLIVLPIIMAAN
jgi:CheY-like chemotaxis protein